MNTIGNFKVGDKVHFGRSHGEQTLGEVVKVNRVKLKVRQLDARGTYRSYPVGTIWTVPVNLCTLVGGQAAAPAPVMSPEVQERLRKQQEANFNFLRGRTNRTEAEIKREILGLYGALSPENLYCDGEISHSQASRKARSLNARLQACFRELGRIVTEDEAYRMVG